MEGGCTMEQMIVNATSEVVGSLSEKLGTGNAVVNHLSAQVNRQKRKLGSNFT